MTEINPARTNDNLLDPIHECDQIAKGNLGNAQNSLPSKVVIGFDEDKGWILWLTSTLRVDGPCPICKTALENGESFDIEGYSEIANIAYCPACGEKLTEIQK